MHVKWWFLWGYLGNAVQSDIFCILLSRFLFYIRSLANFSFPDLMRLLWLFSFDIHDCRISPTGLFVSCTWSSLRDRSFSASSNLFSLSTILLLSSSVPTHVLDVKSVDCAPTKTDMTLLYRLFYPGPWMTGKFSAYGPALCLWKVTNLSTTTATQLSPNYI